MSDWNCCVKGCKNKNPEELHFFPSHGKGKHIDGDYCLGHFTEIEDELDRNIAEMRGEPDIETEVELEVESEVELEEETQDIPTNEDGQQSLID